MISRAVSPTKFAAAAVVALLAMSQGPAEAINCGSEYKLNVSTSWQNVSDQPEFIVDIGGGATRTVGCDSSHRHFHYGSAAVAQSSVSNSASSPGGIRCHSESLRMTNGNFQPGYWGIAPRGSDGQSHITGNVLFSDFQTNNSFWGTRRVRATWVGSPACGRI